VNKKGEENSQGCIRPVQAKFSPKGKSLYIVDFGILGIPTIGKKTIPKTGSI
jgi:hypothetical protein